MPTFVIMIGILFVGILIGACISYCIAANRFMDETHKITEKYSKMFGDLISHCNQYIEGNSDRMLNILDVIKNLCDMEDQFTEGVSKIIAELENNVCELQKNEKSRSEMQNESLNIFSTLLSVNDERWELIQDLTNLITEHEKINDERWNLITDYITNDGPERAKGEDKDDD